MGRYFDTWNEPTEEDVLHYDIKGLKWGKKKDKEEYALKAGSKTPDAMREKTSQKERKNTLEPYKKKKKKMGPKPKDSKEYLQELVYNSKKNG